MTVSNRYVNGDLLTAREVVEQYPGAGLSQAQLWRWSRNGQISSVKLPSGRRRFPRAEIERVLTPQAPTSPDEASAVAVEPGQQELTW